MVNRFLRSARGQAVTEYIVMLSILTLIGIWIFHQFAPRMGKSSNGAINRMSQDATTKIARDQ